MKREAGRWPFARSPGEVAADVYASLAHFNGDMIAALREVFIEKGEPLKHLYSITEHASIDPEDWASARLAANASVPREPTVAMLRVHVNHALCGHQMSGCTLGAVWRAMWDAYALASPPSAPAPAASEWEIDHRAEGLSLRDYFAAQALAGMCSTRDEAGTLIAHGYEWLAREAFQIADAMLAERAK